MPDELRRLFINKLIIAVSILSLIVLLKNFFPDSLNFLNTDGNFIPGLVLTVSAACGLGIPILFRSTFAYRNRARRSISATEYFVFENRLINISIVPVYFVIIAFLGGFAPFYLYGIILIAMYTPYYYYPSKRRLDLDRRIFRVTAQDKDS